MQQIGGSIGVAIFRTLAASSATDHTSAATTPAGQAAAGAQAAIEGYATVYLWSGVVFAVGAVLAAVLLGSGTIEPDGEPVLTH